MKYKRLAVLGAVLLLASAFIGIKLYTGKSNSIANTSASANKQKDNPSKNTGKSGSNQQPAPAVNSIGSANSSNENSKVQKTGLDITTEGITPNIEGSSSGNLSNGGYFAEQGKWMYFTLTSTSIKTYPLYRAMKDGQTGLKALTPPGTIRYINVVGDWIYYINGNTPEQPCIYRTKTDGSQTEKVCDDYVTQMFITNGYIYYTALDGSNSSIYRLKLGDTIEKKDQVLASGSYFSNIYVSGNTIYTLIQQKRQVKDGSLSMQFTANGAVETYFALYTMNLDGSNLKQVTDANCSKYIVNNNYIYYSNVDTHGLYRIRPDGSEKTKLVNYFVNAFNIYDNCLYFTGDGEEFNNIYKLKLDGSKPVKLTHNSYSYNNTFNSTSIDTIFDINVIGDSLFYSGVSANGRTISIVKTDGSYERRIE